MNALPSRTVIHDRQIFERNLTRALWLAPLLGLLAQLIAKGLGLGVHPSTLCLGAALLGMGLSVSLDAGDALDRALLCGISLLPPSMILVGQAMRLDNLTVFLAAAALVGILPVHAQRCRTGVEGGLARARPTPVHHAAGAAATAGLTTLGVFVGAHFGDWLKRSDAPLALQALAFCFTIALFGGLGALAAHLLLAPDPLVRRAEALQQRLPASIQSLLERALSAYRACGALLEKLPRDPVRDELAQMVSRLTSGVLDGAEAWSIIGDRLGPKSRAQLDLDLAHLTGRAERTQDPLTRAHLERAAGALHEETLRLQGIELERERALAQLEADAMLLDQARVALLGASSRDARERLGDVDALSRRLRTLAAIEYGAHDPLSLVAASTPATDDG